MSDSLPTIEQPLASGAGDNTKPQTPAAPTTRNDTDLAHAILSGVTAPESVKGDAWDVYQNSTGDDFEQKLGALQLPQEVKANLWDAKNSPEKFSLTHPDVIAPPAAAGAHTNVHFIGQPTATTLAPANAPAGQAESSMRWNGKDWVHGAADEAVGSLKSLLMPVQEGAPSPVGVARKLYSDIGAAGHAVQAYEAARQKGASYLDAYKAANEVAKQHVAQRDMITDRIKEFSKNPESAEGRAFIDILFGLATGKVMGAAGDLEVPGGFDMTTGAPLTNPSFTAPMAGSEAAEASAPTAPVAKPGIIQQALKGPKVAQPGTEAAVRGAVRTAAEGTENESLMTNIENQPIAQGQHTLIDEHLDDILQDEKAVYQKADQVAGKALGQDSFDLKAEKLALSNDKYKLSQLGNTDADLTQKGNLVESINDSEARIAKVNQALKDAGIDPHEADALHTRRMAGQDVRKVLAKNTDAQGNLNVKGLTNDMKNLRNFKVGATGKVVDRLSQYLGGEEAADKFVSELSDQKLLADKALWYRRVRYLLTYEVIKHTVGRVLPGADKAVEFLP